MGKKKLPHCELSRFCQSLAMSLEAGISMAETVERAMRHLVAGVQ